MAGTDERQGKDHHLGLRFWVQIEGIEIAGFSECSGLTYELEVFEYAEGGLSDYVHKLPGRSKFGNVTLKRGMDMSQDLYRWSTMTITPFITNGEGQRRNISIMVYGPKDDQPVYRWDLKGAFPVKWVGPDLKSDAGATAIETLEFAHHGIIGFHQRTS